MVCVPVRRLANIMIQLHPSRVHWSSRASGREPREAFEMDNESDKQDEETRNARTRGERPPGSTSRCGQTCADVCSGITHNKHWGGGNKPDCSWSRKMSSDKQMVFKWANTICFVKSVTVVLEKRHKGEILHPWNWVTWLMIIRWVCFAIKSSRTAMGLL